MSDTETFDILEQRKAYNATLTQAADKTRATWFPVVVLLLLLAMPALQFVGNYNYLLHLLLFTLSYVVIASGWNILGGFAGYISLGHNVFFAVGGYFAGMMFARLGISTLILAPLAGLVAGLLGYLIGLITPARPRAVLYYLVAGIGDDLPDFLRELGVRRRCRRRVPLRPTT